jgi:RNA-binding protein NOB1
MEGIISKTVDNLVIDSKALIVGGLKLKDKAQNYYTVEEVFKEVRHKQAREELNLLPFELKVRVPSEEAMKIGIILYL